MVTAPELKIIRLDADDPIQWDLRVSAPVQAAVDALLQGKEVCLEE